MNRLLNEIVGDFFGVRLSPLFSEEGFIDEGSLGEKEFLDLYSEYVKRAVDYIKRNGMHLDGMVFEKYFTEPDYETDAFEPVYLNGLRELNRQKVFEVRRGSARVYRSNRNCRVMVRDFSKDLKNEEDLLFESTLQYKLGENGFRHDFYGLRDHVYLVVFRFGDFNLPFLLHNFGFDEFSLIRRKVVDLFGIYFV